MSTGASEKVDLLPTTVPEVKRRRKALVRKLHLVPLLLIALALYQYGCSHHHSRQKDEDFSEDVKQELCPQPGPLTPSKNGELWSTLGKSFETKEFKERAISLLSEAVQIPYVSAIILLAID